MLHLTVTEGMPQERNFIHLPFLRCVRSLCLPLQSADPAPLSSLTMRVQTALDNLAHPDLSEASSDLLCELAYIRCDQPEPSVETKGVGARRFSFPFKSSSPAVRSVFPPTRSVPSRMLACRSFLLSSFISPTAVLLSLSSLAGEIDRQREREGGRERERERETERESPGSDSPRSIRCRLSARHVPGSQE